MSEDNDKKLECVDCHRNKKGEDGYFAGKNFICTDCLLLRYPLLKEHLEDDCCYVPTRIYEEIKNKNS